MSVDNNLNLNSYNQGGIIAWFANNSVAANLLMLSIIFLGLMSFNPEGSPQNQSTSP